MSQEVHPERKIIHFPSIDGQTTRLTLGPWLEFDPDAERVLGNDAANALLTREYRPPFVVPSEKEI